MLGQLTISPAPYFDLSFLFEGMNRKKRKEGKKGKKGKKEIKEEKICFRLCVFFSENQQIFFYQKSFCFLHLFLTSPNIPAWHLCKRCKKQTPFWGLFLTPLTEVSSRDVLLSDVRSRSEFVPDLWDSCFLIFFNWKCFQLFKILQN